MLSIAVHDRLLAWGGQPREGGLQHAATRWSCVRGVSGVWFLRCVVWPEKGVTHFTRLGMRSTCSVPLLREQRSSLALARPAPAVPRTGLSLRRGRLSPARTGYDVALLLGTRLPCLLLPGLFFCVGVRGWLRRLFCLKKKKRLIYTRGGTRRSHWVGSALCELWQ